MKCMQKREDCIFNTPRGCDILTDTHFTRPCPFFKKGKRTINSAEDIYVYGYAGVFKTIAGLEGLYYVNEDGLVYSTRSKKFINWRHYKTGQVFVNLTKEDGLITAKLVDRLVADAFLGGKGGVIHLDGDLDNCNIWNLRRKGGKDEHED